jgi:hypothetical protein
MTTRWDIPEKADALADMQAMYDQLREPPPLVQPMITSPNQAEHMVQAGMAVYAGDPNPDYLPEVVPFLTSETLRGIDD